MWEVVCCICNEKATSPYNFIQHLDNGKARIYEGHKRCLFLVESKLSNGEEIPHTEIDIPRNKINIRRCNMNAQLQKLMESKIAYIRDIAHLLSDCNCKLDDTATYDLMGLLLGMDSSFDTFIQEETGKVYWNGYADGKVDRDLECRK